MKPVKTKLVVIGNNFYLCVPKSIAELMNWNVGDVIGVPFHELKVELVTEEEPIVNFQEKINVKEYDNIEITRKEVIQLLENNPCPDLFNYRTAYIEWKGKKFGSKAIMKKLLKDDDFNTLFGELYLRKLGFTPMRINKVQD